MQKKHSSCSRCEMGKEKSSFLSLSANAVLVSLNLKSLKDLYKWSQDHCRDYSTTTQHQGRRLYMNMCACVCVYTHTMQEINNVIKIWNNNKNNIIIVLFSATVIFFKYKYYRILCLQCGIFYFVFEYVFFVALYVCCYCKCPHCGTNEGSSYLLKLTRTKFNSNPVFICYLF